MRYVRLGTGVEVTERDVLIGDRYRLVERIGSGAMGVVWEGWDQRLERRVAIKLLHQQPGLSEEDRQLANDRAMREARISARLHHRHAVPVFDVVDHRGQPCLVMQFVPSMPLSAVVREGGPLTPSEAAQTGAQVASALAAAHQAGIVHRDIKPGNILIADDGTAMICDFGISRALGDATLTQTGLVHGTPAYLAPEVARGGEATAASDVFSLGATLYSAIEGAPPFGTDSNPIALLYRVAGGSFDPPQRSGELAPLLEAMLSTSPEDRPSMAAVAQQFADFRAEVPTPVTPETAMPPTLQLAPPPPRLETPVVDERDRPTLATRPDAPTPRRSRRWILAVLAAAAVVVALVLWQLPDGSQVANPPPTPSSSPASTPTKKASPTPSAPSPTPSAPSPTPSAPSPTPSPTASRSASPSSGTPTAAELARAITEYYALVPDDLDRSWPRLTNKYQNVTSGGRASYGRFWGAIRSVAVSGVTGSPPSAATATITYTYKDGRVSKERTTFQLVRSGGILKIDQSRVG